MANYRMPFIRGNTRLRDHFSVPQSNSTGPVSDELGPSFSIPVFSLDDMMNLYWRIRSLKLNGTITVTIPVRFLDPSVTTDTADDVGLNVDGEFTFTITYSDFPLTSYKLRNDFLALGQAHNETPTDSELANLCCDDEILSVQQWHYASFFPTRIDPKTFANDAYQMPFGVIKFCSPGYTPTEQAAWPDPFHPEISQLDGLDVLFSGTGVLRGADNPSQGGNLASGNNPIFTSWGFPVSYTVDVSPTGIEVLKPAPGGDYPAWEGIQTSCSIHTYIFEGEDGFAPFPLTELGLSWDPTNQQFAPPSVNFGGFLTLHSFGPWAGKNVNIPNLAGFNSIWQRYPPDRTPSQPVPDWGSSYKNDLFYNNVHFYDTDAIYCGYAVNPDIPEWADYGGRNPILIANAIGGAWVAYEITDEPFFTDLGPPNGFWTIPVSYLASSTGAPTFFDADIALRIKVVEFLSRYLRVGWENNFNNPSAGFVVADALSILDETYDIILFSQFDNSFFNHPTSASASLSLAPTEFWPYKDSQGNPVYDILSGAQINDPFG